MIKRFAFVLIVLITGCASVCAQQSESTPAERGRSEAVSDIQNGKFVIKTWGLSDFGFNDIPTRSDVYEALLADKFNIRFEWVSGCLIDEETLSYANAHNEVARAAIEAKFGKDILETVREEADREYELKYGEKMREFDRKFREAIQQLPKKNNQ